MDHNGSVASFREGVSFVPVEVLESYLEDLLDLSIKDTVLNIHQTQKWFQSLKVLALGLLGSVVGGMYSVSTGASLLSSLSLTAVLGSPFLSILYVVPKMSLMRRIRFARVLSAEVSRRRGRDGTTRTPVLTFGTVLKGTTPTFHGATRTIFDYH